MNLKDEKMQEDTTREPPPDTLVVQLTPCFCSPGSKVTFGFTPLLTLYLLSLI